MHKGQADLALVEVHADDANFDLHAKSNDVLGAFDLVIGKLRNVEKTFEIVLELHKDTEVGDLRSVARKQVADVVVVRNRIHPRVGGELLQAQGDTTLVHVNRENNASELVALLDRLGGVRDLLSPGHVRDVEKAIDTLFDLDECAVGREVADATFDDRALWVVLLS